MTGDLLIRMSGQGAVYIREVHNLSDGQCSDVNDSDHLLMIQILMSNHFLVPLTIQELMRQVSVYIVPRTYFAHLQRN